MIDIGANLTNKAFGSDLPEVLERALAAGVGRIVVTGTDINGSRAAKRLAEQNENLLFTAGVHPHDADHVEPNWLEHIRELVAEGAVAVGETGLDFYRDFSAREAQRTIFRAQLELAAELDMPVFVHDRDSDGEVLTMLEQHAKTPVVVHCFTGSGELLDAYLELGCFIGITGWVCDPNRGGELAELVPRIPDDRLMIETDSPYLMPKNVTPKPKSRRNEPMNLTYVCAKVAEIRDQSNAHVDQITTANAKRFFRF